MVWCVDEVGYNKLSYWGANTALMQETGLSILEESLNKNKTYSNERPLKLVWSGMITPGKALYILIEALIKIKDFNFQLTIIGDGDLRNQMHRLSTPILEKVCWTGWVSKEKAMEIVKHSDLLIHTSLKEGTPHSILEAIGMGIPVICHDTCGMGVVVNNNNGFKMPYIDSKTSIEYISNKIIEIVMNPTILNDKFKTIWDTTESLTWDNKVDIIAKSIENKLENKN